MKVSLIGMGCCPGEHLLPAAAERLREAELIVGAPRLLAALPQHGARTAEAVRAEDILSVLAASGAERTVAVFSGDTGFFSGTARLLERLRDEPIETEVFPGISSVQVFAARLGRPWQDWNLCSAHGARCDVLAELKQGKPVFLLTSGRDDPGRICGELTAAGLGDCPVYVGEDLSCLTESIRRGTAREMAEGEFSPLNVLLVAPERDMYPELRSPGIPDGEFVRGDVPMTKQEVRAVLLGKLGVRPDDFCWDVGAGTGSVSVELAMAGRAVWAVEKNETACELIRRNRKKFRAWNLRLVPGEAPGVLEQLPAPDAVFVGGSTGRMEEILSEAVRRNPAVRLCVSAVTLESLHAAERWMRENGCDPEVVQLSVCRTRSLGNSRLLAANNPVFLITGQRK